MELILKAKDIRVEFKGRTCLDIDELEVYDYDRNFKWSNSIYVSI